MKKKNAFLSGRVRQECKFYFTCSINTPKPLYDDLNRMTKKKPPASNSSMQCANKLNTETGSPSKLTREVGKGPVTKRKIFFLQNRLKKSPNHIKNEKNLNKQEKKKLCSNYTFKNFFNHFFVKIYNFSN